MGHIYPIGIATNTPIRSLPRTVVYCTASKLGSELHSLEQPDPSGGALLESQMNQSPSLERVKMIGDYVVYRLLY